MQWHQKGKISQQIYKTYPLAGVAQALQDMMDRKIMGKAVVQIS